MTVDRLHDEVAQLKRAADETGQQIPNLSKACSKAANDKRWDDAASSCRAAALRGDAVSAFHLGLIHYFGWGRPENLVSAFGWWYLSAEEGEASGAYNIAFMLRNAKGVKEDMPEALHWFRIAHDRGHKDAGYQIGTIYELGAGPVGKDQAQALQWYEASAKMGNTRAVEALKRLRH